MGILAKHRIEAKLGTTADQVADMEEGDLTDFDATTPAWDKEVDAVADFDSETDVDGDMNDAGYAAHDGAVGLEITFDDANTAYGTMNASAIDRTSGVISFWLDPNTVSLDNTKLIRLIDFRDGAAQANLYLQVKNNAGTYQIRIRYRDDGGLINSSYVDLVDDYQKIDLHFAMSTGAGNDDGFIYLYLDDALEDSVTNIDSDTLDWDYVRAGMTYTNSVGFGGSFYMDTIKIDPVGAPMADKLAAVNGTYGMSIPIMDTTNRYVTFTGPTAETRVTAECNFDLNSIVMADFDTFRIMTGDTDWRVDFRINSGNYQIRIYSIEDGGSQTTSYVTISDSLHHIRVVWVAASGVGNDDGYMLLYIDDVLERSLTGLDNDTKDIGTIAFGAISGVDAGTYGIIHFDDCRWGPWVDITDDQVGNITGQWGSMREDHTQFIADTGVMRIVLNNSTGKYTPGITGSLDGFEKGISIRLVISYSGNSYRRFYGTINELEIRTLPIGGERVMVTVTDWLDYVAETPLISPDIETNQRGEEMITTLLEVIPIAPLNTDLAVGVNTFETAFDTLSVKTRAYSEFSKISVSELGYIYLTKDPVYGETLVFENAETRNGLRTPDFTADNTMISLEVEHGENIINRFANIAFPRYTEAGISVLFSLGSPMKIGSGQSVIFRGNYTDPSGGNPAIGANMIAPVITTDYLMNADKDGGGDNLSADLTVTPIYGSAGVTYTLTNESSFVGWVTHLQARGYMVFKYNQIEASAENTDSQDEYGFSEKRLRQHYQHELNRGALYGASILEQERRPRNKLNKVWFYANKSDALMDAWLTRDVGDLVYLKEDKIETDKYFYILGVAFTITPGGFVKFCWVLKGMLSLLLGLSLISCEFDGNGSKDCVDYGYLPQVSDNAASTRSFSAWIYVHVDTPVRVGYDNGHVMGPFSDAAGTGVGVTNGLKIKYYQKGALGPGIWDTPGNSVTLNTWIHILATRDASVPGNAPIIYIDAVSQALTNTSVQNGATVSETGNLFFVGNIKTATRDYDRGVDAVIKDIRVFDVILTQAEATTLAAGGNVTRGMVFQAPCVKTSELSDFEDLTLTTSDKMIDNMYGMIGTPNNSVITRLIP